jgi:CDP-glucose 4,6-dehydratase
VLDPLSGYLWLGARMLEEGAGGLAEAWNFGPDRESAVTVRELADRIVRAWGDGRWEAAVESAAPHEAAFLGLCCDKAVEKLGWRPVYDLEAAVEATVAWHRRAEGPADMFAFTVGQIRDYVERARALGVAWAGPAAGASAR